MALSTQDCRDFIIDFQRRNPHIEEARFDGELEADGMAALVDPSNWKRRWKVRPSAQTDEHDPKTSYGVYHDGTPVNRHVDSHGSVDASTIAWERRFECAPFEGQVAYLILETTDGRLLFGEYVGD